MVKIGQGDHPRLRGEHPQSARQLPGGPSDHPRLRGEHKDEFSTLAADRGPPPPARGARRAVLALPAEVGTTPACAGSTWTGPATRPVTGDHPRLRGEHLLSKRRVREFSGPPPPARGAQAHLLGEAGVGGTTPACAGSTTVRFVRVAISRDHPRLRGEHHASTMARNQSKGPPPPARGARDHVGGVGDDPGTTPACAGSTWSGAAISSPPRDHPRLRGEHYRRNRTGPDAAGPPPPARGARSTAAPPSLAGGTTPACAGSTSSTARTPRSSRDHPRLRGEHPSMHAFWSGCMGPPPPARGARGPRRRGLPAHGTTPACAGSTSAPWCSTWPRRDHPRLRGEHLTPEHFHKLTEGPPPPARGAPVGGRVWVDMEGTTPACAGSTSCQGEGGAPPRDHPRLRGEHVTTPRYTKRVMGPPPPARGAPLQDAEQHRATGTTPACAGSTTCSAA